MRLSYAKVAEYQRRGLVHFPAVIRLEGPGGPEAAPLGWTTAALLADGVRAAVGLVRLDAAGAEVVGGAYCASASRSTYGPSWPSVT